ncbi:S9 family peptidase, partial [Pseudomonas syringae pv. tagetis]
TNTLHNTREQQYNHNVKQITNRQDSNLPYENCEASITLANDIQTLFFGELQETHRPARLDRDTLGSSSAVQLFDEPDGRLA